MKKRLLDVTASQNERAVPVIKESAVVARSRGAPAAARRPAAALWRVRGASRESAVARARNTSERTRGAGEARRAHQGIGCGGESPQRSCSNSKTCRRFFPCPCSVRSHTRPVTPTTLRRSALRMNVRCR